MIIIQLVLIVFIYDFTPMLVEQDFLRDSEEVEYFKTNEPSCKSSFVIRQEIDIYTLSQKKALREKKKKALTCCIGWWGGCSNSFGATSTRRTAGYSRLYLIKRAAGVSE